MLKPFLAVLVCAALSSAQDFPFFPKPSYFKTYFKSPVTQVELENPARLEHFVVEGKLDLSGKSDLELALRHNPHIPLQRLSVDANPTPLTPSFGPSDPSP